MAALRTGVSGEQTARPPKFTKKAYAPSDNSDFKGRHGSLELLLVDPITVVDLCARQLGDRQHSLIVFEDPAELADIDPELSYAVAARVFDEHEGEHARHARLVELARNAHQRNASALHAWIAQPPQQLDEVEREQLAVQILDR